MQKVAEESKRKGARRMADIPPDIMRQLNRGELESRSLAETLAVDFAVLLKSSFPDLHGSYVRQMIDAAGKGWVERTVLAGELLWQGLGPQGIEKAFTHTSDQVRGWAAAAIRAMPEAGLEERLSRVRPLADDTNAGVRETAWLMLRPFVVADAKLALRLLQPWAQAEAENIRRYASEMARPRGVWCAHIPYLRKNPAKGLCILEPLRKDPSRYVQNSVANWLNDASKDDPAFVRDLCKTWLAEGDAKETAYICKRACRTLDKKEGEGKGSSRRKSA